MSYRELDQLANRFARRLQELGVGPDVLVGICLDRSIEATAAILGVLKAGGAYVPLDPNYPANRLAFMVEDAGISIMITCKRWLDLLPTQNMMTLVTDEWDADELTHEEGSECRAGAENLAYVIYTSGSTGRPKGVAMPHRPLVNLIRWQVGRDGFRPGARALQFAPMNFDVSFQEMFSTWSSGGALVLVDEETRGDFEALSHYLAASIINRMYLPPLALTHLAATARFTHAYPRAVSEIICAGEQLTVGADTGRFLERVGARLCNEYGPTETHVVTEFVATNCSLSWPTVPPIGRPINNVRLYILDEGLRPVPAGISGELYIGGVALARGYLNRPALTAERFLPDSFGAPGARMYRTGDRVRCLPDGNLVFLARLDQQVKIRGFRVEIGEVEAVLCEHQDVAQAAIVARREADGLLSLVAYVVLKPESTFASRELRQFLSSKLPEHMIPSTFMQLDALPVSPNGKIDRPALPLPDWNIRGGAAFVAPRSGLEEIIARVWAEVLHIDRVGAEDNFFDLGGHSLLATQVVSRLRQLLVVNLPLRVMFEPPSTVAELAKAVVINGAEDVDFEETARLIQEIEQLTEGELERSLETDVP
jgi:amino acid adenylation domain-containing protein